MSEGPFVTLASICEFVRYGYTASASEQEVGPRFLRITDIVPDAIDWDSVPFCKINDADEERFAVAPGDIVVARTGATVGYAKLIREPVNAVFASYLVLFRIDTQLADAGFVGRLVESFMYKDFVRSRVGGAAQPNANAQVLGSFEFRLPARREQKRIVDILSSYDALLKTNQRRIQLIEESVRLLYREWFVYFRFPGHEHIRVVQDCPQGWELVTVDDICSVARGASPRPINAFMDGTVPWLKIGDATASESPFIFFTQEHVTEDGAKKSVPVQPGDLILSNSATCGIPYFAGVPACIHDGWLYFSDFRKVSPIFLYCHLHQSRQILVSSVSDGSTQKNLNTSAVGRLKIALPTDQSLIEQFESMATMAFAGIETLARQNIALRRARDLLLPKLMSGEVAV